MPESEPELAVNIGDRVRVRSPSPYTPVGRVVEFRGPLGPGGAMVYRIRYKGGRRPVYTELLAKHFEVLPPEPPYAPLPADDEGPADVAQQADVQHGEHQPH